MDNDMKQDAGNQNNPEMTAYQGEILFQALFERSADANLILEANTFVDCNLAAVQMLRAQTKEEVLSTHPSQLSPQFQPDGRPSAEKADAMIQIALEKGSHRFEWIHRRVDGSDFPVEVLLTPIQLADRQLVYTVWRDISTQKVLEQEIQSAYQRRGEQVQISTEISQEIAQAAELSELFRQVVNLTKERLGYYHTQLLRYDPVQDAVVLIYGYGATGARMLAQGHRMALGRGLIGTAAESGETVLRANLADDPDWAPNPLLSETRGEIAVPIKLGDQVLGVLDVQSSQAGELSEDDRLLLEGLCGQIAIAMEQTRLRQEMEERLREVNNLYRAMSREGWRAFERVAQLPDGFQFNQADIQPITGKELEQMEAIFAPLTVPGGELVGALGVEADDEHPLSGEDEALIRQVSEQVALALESARLFEQTQIALAETRSLYRFSEVISAETDVDAMYAAVSALLLDELGFTNSWIAAFDAERQLIRGVSGAGQGMNWDSIHAEIPLEHAKMPAAFAIRQAQTVIVNDPNSDARMGDVPAQMKTVMGKAIATPVLVSDRVVAVLAATRSIHTPDLGEREERILRVVATQLAIAIQRAELFEQTQAALQSLQLSEARLRTIVDNAPEAIVIVNVETGLFMEPNENALNLYGLDADEILKVGPAQMSPPVQPNGLPSLDMAMDYIEAALAGEKPIFEWVHRNAQDEDIDCEIRLVRMPDPTRKLVRASVVDIRQRKQAQEMLNKRVRELNCLSDIGHMIDEQPTLEVFLPQVAGRIPAAMQYPEDCIAAITLDEHVYGDLQALESEHKMVGGIRIAGELVGYVQIAYTRPHTFLDEESSFIGGVVGRVTSYIENQRAYAQIQQRTTELAVLNEMGRALTTLQDETAIFETIHKFAGRVMDVNSFFVARYDEDARQFTLPVMIDKGQRTDLPPQPAGNSLTDYIIRTQQSLLLSEYSDDEVRQLGVDPVIVGDNNPTLSWLGVPLIYQERVLGVIAVQSETTPGLYTEHDRDLLTSIASQAAIALENAHAFQQAQRQAEHEAMINLISQRIQSTTSVEDALQVAIRELGRALGARQTSVQLGTQARPNPTGKGR
ncbi:MAG: GAF domain-containing protein [Anaerolineales bacterium]|nr:GAF domain-containing protein [Anaerolineales bacterium]